jgi:DNA polymerase III epsilon subunit-like protein
MTTKYSNPKNIMLDLETQSVRPHAAILTIGAIKFDTNGKLPPIDKLKTFYRRITMDSCLEEGLHIDPETMAWWAEQDEKASYEAIGNPDRIPLRQALTEFSDWVGDYKYTKIYANSPDFDITIIREAYKRCEMESKIPFNFWSVRCTRTIYDLGGVKLKDFPNNIKHHALYDCYAQILAMKEALKRINS